MSDQSAYTATIESTVRTANGATDITAIEAAIGSAIESTEQSA